MFPCVPTAVVRALQPFPCCSVTHRVSSFTRPPALYLLVGGAPETVTTCASDHITGVLRTLRRPCLLKNKNNTVSLCFLQRIKIIQSLSLSLFPTKSFISSHHSPAFCCFTCRCLTHAHCAHVCRTHACAAAGLSSGMFWRCCASIALGESSPACRRCRCPGPLQCLAL